MLPNTKFNKISADTLKLSVVTAVSAKKIPENRYIADPGNRRGENIDLGLDQAESTVNPNES